MILRLATAARNAALAGPGVASLVDAGSGPGTIKIYGGSMPANPATAPGSSPLATVVLGDPAFSAPSTGVSAGADPAAVNATAGGAATWCRMADSDGNTVLDGDVTATGGGGFMQLSNTTLTSGAPVDVTSLQLTMPAS
ncbi:MAG TPA: hypothetical protein VGF17_16270 [Phytomonospora sp.]